MSAEYHSPNVNGQDIAAGLRALGDLCDEYNSGTEKDYVKHKILKYLPYFYTNKEWFKEVAHFFDDLGLEEFRIRAENIYYGHRAVLLRDEISVIPIKQYIERHESLREELISAQYGKIFSHYMDINALLKNVDADGKPSLNSENKIIASLLNDVSWGHKAFAYFRKIKEIIKYNSERTKSSVIIISNNSSDEIIEGIREIFIQRKNDDDYKIIFVSNNENNCVHELIELVDTFILMNSNDGAYLARNIGSIFARSDILIFMEDDGVPDHYFVKAHENLHVSDLSSARGAYLTKSNGIMPAWYWLGNKTCPSPTNLEGNSSFNARKFYECGGWGDYIFFGHGGYEICHRMLKKNSTPEQHIYSPAPKIYHDYCIKGKNLENKKLAQHASWQVIKFSYDDFHDIRKKWPTINNADYYFKLMKLRSAGIS